MLPEHFYYIIKQLWIRGRFSGGPFWGSFGWFFLREMTENPQLTNHWVFSLHFFCNDIYFVKEHHATMNDSIWASGWSGMEIYTWKVGFTPRPIRHCLRDGQFSSSGSVESLQPGLSFKTNLETCPPRRPYPGIMPKPYPFWASDNPLWHFALLQAFGR